MSMLTKILAVFLLGLALALGIVAYRLANAPAPAPAVVAEPEVSVPVPAPAPVSVAPPGHDVVVARRDLLAGEVLHPDLLEIRQWSQRPDAAFASPDTLAGRTLRLPLSKGEPVLQPWLAQGLSTYLEPDYRALSIPVDDVAGAGNTIRPGDVVDVFFTLNRDRDQIRDTQARLLLSAVQVLAYGDESVDGPLGSRDESSRRESGRTSRMAILAVPLDEVSDTLLAVRNGALQLVLRAPDDPGHPDPALFPERQSVLAARAGLTDEEKNMLERASNRAFAGVSLSGLAGSPSGETHAQPEQADVRPAGTGRRLQLIRGSQVQSLPY